MNAETNGVEEETKDGRACCSPPKAFSSSSFRSNSRQSLLTNCGNRFRPFLDRDVWKGKAPLLLRKKQQKISAAVKRRHIHKATYSPSNLTDDDK
jgi:hypothetical protein